MAYKLIKTDGHYSIQKGNTSFGKQSSMYQDFLEDIALERDTVEGADILTPSYAELREADYPSIQEQLDMQYWDSVNGTSTWSDSIQAVKDAHSKTIAGGVEVEDLPSWIQEDVDEWIQNKQLKEYSEAVERLSRYIISEGVEEVKQDVVVFTEDVLNSNGEATYDESGNKITKDIVEEIIVTHAVPAQPATITQSTYHPETGSNVTEVVDNPLIVEDVAQRESAQAIIDATPQAVIDIYNRDN